MVETSEIIKVQLMCDYDLVQVERNEDGTYHCEVCGETKRLSELLQVTYTYVCSLCNDKKLTDLGNGQLFCENCKTTNDKKTAPIKLAFRNAETLKAVPTTKDPKFRELLIKEIREGIF